MTASKESTFSQYVPIEEARRLFEKFRTLENIRVTNPLLYEWQAGEIIRSISPADWGQLIAEEHLRGIAAVVSDFFANRD